MKNMKRVLSVLMLVVLLVTSTSLTAFAATKGVTTGECNVRKSASKKAAAITTIPAGKTISISKTKRDSRGVTWCYTSYNGRKGWVSARYLRASGTTKRVHADGDCFIRSGAGKKYSKRTTMLKGHSGYYMGKSKKDSRKVRWYYVNYGGIIGWASEKFVSVY